MSAVNVNNGVFSVRLDFGNQFPGANRFLEIRVKQSTDQFFTVLTPRQAITSAPYAIKSLDAESASNTNQLGGVAASQYVLTTDARMSDARTPTPGSPEYIQNRSTQQPLSNFNVSGNGFVGGTLSANTALAIGTTAPAATFHLRINGGNVLAGGAGCNLGFT